MSGFNIVSTTDSEAEVLSAIGGKKEVAAESVSEEAKKPVQEEIESKESDALEQEEAQETDEKSESEVDESKDEDQPKKKNGFKKRIDKLRKNLSEKDAEVEYWKSQALKGQPKSEEKPKAEAASKEDSDKKPKVDDFETYAEYTEALTDWKLEKKDREKAEKEEKQKAQSAAQELNKSFESKLEKFKEEAEDFEDVVENVNFNVQPWLVDAAKSAEIGPKLIYELAKDHEELRRINSLPYLSAIRELGKFEAKLLALEPQKNQKQQTKAPPPIKPVGSKSAGKIEKSPEDMTFQEFKKWREAGNR